MVMPRLLMMEHERIIARNVAQRLTKLGYMVVAIVESGREAMQQADDLRPDLVLMETVAQHAGRGTWILGAHYESPRAYQPG